MFKPGFHIVATVASAANFQKKVFATKWKRNQKIWSDKPVTVFNTSAVEIDFSFISKTLKTGTRSRQLRPYGNWVLGRLKRQSNGSERPAMELSLMDFLLVIKATRTWRLQLTRRQNFFYFNNNMAFLQWSSMNGCTMVNNSPCLHTFVGVNKPNFRS